VGWLQSRDWAKTILFFVPVLSRAYRPVRNPRGTAALRSRPGRGRSGLRAKALEKQSFFMQLSRAGVEMIPKVPRLPMRARVKICRKESTSFSNLRSLRSTVSEAHARNVWNRSRVIILTLPRLDLISFLFQYPPCAVPDFGLVVDRNRRPTGREESDTAHEGISFHLLLVCAPTV
jgi:hypothetical protein